MKKALKAAWREFCRVYRQQQRIKNLADPFKG